MDPWSIIEKQGIDALRWYMYSVNQPGDPKLFAVRDIDLILRKHFMILWNVLSYLVTYSSYEKWEVRGVRGITGVKGVRGEMGGRGEKGMKGMPFDPLNPLDPLTFLEF